MSTKDTRSRIQEVALELFTEKGYDQTSLREIAERLDVTKAALYYHFKTKEDIVASFVETAMARVDELIKWAGEQERTPGLKRELLKRYVDAMDRNKPLLRFFFENQKAMRDLPIGESFRERMKSLVTYVDDDPTARLADRLRARMAFFAIHAGIFILGDDIPATDEERLETVLEVATELVTGGPARAARSDTPAAPPPAPATSPAPAAG